MRQFQYPAICTLSAVIIFFGCLDLVRSVQVVSGQDWLQFERFAEIILNHAQEDCESEKESKSGEETESKESKKKGFEVDDCDEFWLNYVRIVQLKSGHRLGNSSSRVALASARIWEPPERG